MDVLINDEKINITLEEEKNLGQVISGINAWLEDGNMFIHGIDVDGTPVDFTDDKWRGKSLDKISRLSISAETETILRAEALKTGLEVLETFRLAALEGKREEIDAYKAELTESLQTLLEEIDHSKLMDTLNHILSQEDYTVSLSEYLKGLMIIIEERVRELLQPMFELQNLQSLLEKISEELEETPVYLQTGKEKQAIDAVLRFIELSEKSIRVFRILSSQKPNPMEGLMFEDVQFEDFYTDFNTALGELEEALSNQDTVLIGDLLEYEVVPRLEKLSGFTSAIVERGV